MTHYQPFFARPPGHPSQTPIYSGRPLTAAATQSPFARQSFDAKQPPPPPKHPVQQQRSHSAQGHAPQAGSSAPTQMNSSYQRPGVNAGVGGQQQPPHQQHRQQMGVVQRPYNPPYAQTQTQTQTHMQARVGGGPVPVSPTRGPAPYAGQPPYQAQAQAQAPQHSPTRSTPYQYQAPGQPQRTYTYPQPGQPVHPTPPTSAPGSYPHQPTQSQSAYARGLSAFQQLQQRQHQTPPTAHHTPAPAALQQYAQSKPTFPSAQVAPTSNLARSGSRRPLPTPGPSGTSPSRGRPVSMPPQASPYSQPPPASGQPYSHSSSSSLSHIVPTSSFSSTSSLPSASPAASSFPSIPRNASPTRRPLPAPSPSPSPQPPEAHVPVPLTSAPIGIPRSTNMQFPQSSSPTKTTPTSSFVNQSGRSTSPQRRTLPTSPPTGSQTGTNGPMRQGTVSTMASNFAGPNVPSSPTKTSSQPPTNAYTPRAPIRASALPTSSAPTHSTQPILGQPFDDDSVTSFSDEETTSSLYGAAETEHQLELESASSQATMSPQYGIRDLPSRRAVFNSAVEPQSPQYGILDLPKRAKSVYDKRRAWEQQAASTASGSSTPTARGLARGRSIDTRRTGPASPPKPLGPSPSSSPPKSSSATLSSSNALAKPAAPTISPSKSPQPQKPQQEQTLPMPPVRHPKPSRTERTPSWTLPTADLDRIGARHGSVKVPPPPLPTPLAQTPGAKGTSMAFRLATMSLDEEREDAQTQTQGHQNSAPIVSAPVSSRSRQASPARPSAYEQAMRFKEAQKAKQEEERRHQQQQNQQRTHSKPPSHPNSRVSSPSKDYPPFAMKTLRVAPANLDLSLDDAPPPPTLRRSPSPSPSTSSSSVPSVPTIRTPDDAPTYGAGSYSGGYASRQGHPQTQPAFQIPVINLPGDSLFDDGPPEVMQGHAPSIVVSPKPMSPAKPPVINLPDGDDFDDGPSQSPVICVSGPPASVVGTPAMPIILNDLANSSSPNSSPTKSPRSLPRPPPSGAPLPSSSSSGLVSRAGSTVRPRGGGLVCGGCHESIIGRIVSAMGVRWHPQCFKCCTCGEFLEHVSSYENDGKPYCHLDYHELFAPQCYHCKTPIIDERFITLDDPALGKRAYHEQHFFCAECGDPFLAPSSPNKARARPALNSHSHPDEDPNEISIKGDGAFDVALDEDGGEVGFTVYRGHPYCETCHVRLRAPKCKGCKRSIRDGMRAVEALGGKWCFECFVCAGCQKPFEEPSFFQRDKKPYCEPCFSIILRNDI